MKLTEKLKDIYEVKGGAEEKPVLGIIKEMRDVNWSKDNDAQMEACDKMMKLAEMDDEEANDFMSYMDNASSSYKGPISKQSESDDEEDDEEDKEDDDEKEDDEEDKDEKKKK